MSISKADFVGPYDMEKGDSEVVVLPVEGDDGPSRNQVDAVFGELDTENGPNYRNVSMLGTIVLMAKATIGTGVLGIPFSFQLTGAVPGILLLSLVIVMITWSNHTVGRFKCNHPEVYSIADAGFVLAGRWGREVFSATYLIYMIFCCGSAMVGIATALNAVSVHGACTAIFIFVAAIVGWACSSVRTLGTITWLGWVGMISIMSAILTLTVAVSIQDRPVEAPPTGPWDKNFKILGTPTFAQAMSSIAAFVFATCNTPTSFGFVSEMRDFRQYHRAMYFTQAFVWATYISIGTVVYFYCGQYVAFPSLGSAGHLMKRVCYGLALPGLMVTLTIYLHLPAKLVFVRALRGSRHLNTNTPTHWMTWLGCTTASALLSYLIGSAIPIFSSLIGLIGALLCPFMCMIPYGFMWWFDNWRGRDPGTRTTALKLQACWAAFVVVAGTFICVAGTYVAVLDIVTTTSTSKPWSCADNSNSV